LDSLFGLIDRQPSARRQADELIESPRQCSTVRVVQGRCIVKRHDAGLAWQEGFRTMILDVLARQQLYCAWMPGLEPAFRFLRERAKPALADGRHEIDGERMFALAARYETRDFDSALPEAHRRYVDVQYLISGRETVYWTPLEDVASVTQPYDPKRDIVFYARNSRARPFELAAGQFAIFFAEDVHEPNCHCGPPAQVHKVVVKIAREWLAGAVG
jgi:YhcH/YjgK/YiaL family protein